MIYAGAEPEQYKSWVCVRFSSFLLYIKGFC